MDGRKTYRHMPPRGRRRLSGQSKFDQVVLSFALAVCLVLVSGLLSITASPAEAGNAIMRLAGERKVDALRVTVGNSKTVETDLSFVDLVVGDPEIADVMPLTDRSLYVLGRKAGTTNVSVYDADRRLIGVIEVEVGYHTSRLRSELARRLPGADISVSSVNGQIVLDGIVPDASSMATALKIARKFSPEVMNSLTIGGTQQVLLEVRFVEASRSAEKSLGVEWKAITDNLTFNAGLSGLPNNATPFGTLLGKLLSSGVDADVLLKALEDRGVARRLAEPNLIALSGEKASFLAGGEFPFPVQADNGTVTIEFKKFGVGLDFTPTVLGNGLINLKVEPEVSQIDTNTTVETAGIAIPSLIVRRMRTTVELRDGQSFAIAGLLQSMTRTTKQQLPWLGQVPAIGALFRSAAFEREETDLVVIVTPHLVQPARPGQRLRTPLDKTLPGNDVDFFVNGKSEIRKTVLAGRIPAGGHILTISRGDR
ncbi:MAG TPA: type II and III secretion system protein family protein [Rhodobacteraceae bacterium]|nr:type II and III secretion system protein family protein [Paracoccaceae bacterium]